ncbi:GNAT family N-acetyltransferase [Myxococcota bacterium]|nr:GNAT family N-acetyltransferase [Myxococcota bacterium]
MYQTDVLDAVAIKGWIDQILRLDRANMAPILRASGMEFPEARRLAVLTNPELTIVAARAGSNLAAYVEFSPDSKVPEGIYVSSLQVDADYRGGIALALVLARAGLVLRRNSPCHLRLDVQRSNVEAQSLFKRLGFAIQEADPESSTLRAFAGSEILESELFEKLCRRFSRAAA